MLARRLAGWVTASDGAERARGEGKAAPLVASDGAAERAMGAGEVAPVVVFCCRGLLAQRREMADSAVSSIAGSAAAGWVSSG